MRKMRKMRKISLAVPYIPHLTQVCSHLTQVCSHVSHLEKPKRPLVTFTSLADKGNVEYVLSTPAREYKRGEHGVELRLPYDSLRLIILKSYYIPFSLIPDTQ
jgi:hypothetical protein